ncbi:hypothetical protein BU16DRAFT_554981 [Lophium mytilinum]|uniref:Uncharacterized protein n=1 Tax=Lophium mytilinum TaxID=390894 RepID=A0A6A6RES9_9PEZI|nr:hypothetical protein BU16DRAFT_554981 [Lophium mytilinum]
MAPGSTRHQRSPSRQEETPKRDQRLRHVNGLEDEILVIGVESADGDSTPTTPHPTQPLSIQPQTPHLHPTPLHYIPLPTIETMLTYPAVPQSVYDTLVSGEGRVSVSPTQRSRTGSNSSNSSISSTSSSNTSMYSSSEASREDWYDSVEQTAAWGQPDDARELQGSVMYGAAGTAVSPRAMRAGYTLGGYWGRPLSKIEESEDEVKGQEIL